MKLTISLLCVLLLCAFVIPATLAWTPLPVANDPLVRMPGTQPRQVTLEAPDRCMNCHAGYNTQVEPGFNWKGSMMAHAARDFLFYACLTVAAQDSIHALGRPNAVDLCERCHFTKGWLEGRSDPPNASAMTGADHDGVMCDTCHMQYNPFYEATDQGIREGSDWLNYWDETNASSTKSQTFAAAAYQADITQSQAIKLFNGGSFFINRLPFSTSYLENGSGQFFISAGSQKRASFADANAKHQILYSRYHKSKYFCGTCHDVSNPALANLSQAGTTPGDGTTILNSEKDSAFSYFHVERTFSEFMLSDYAQQGGSPGTGPFAPESFTTSLPGNNIARCQDCHMRDVVGTGCDKSGVPIRPTGSIEHPKSGQPLHDMTGGNAFVSWVLASAVTGSPNYDPTNASLLKQGPGVLTLDLTQGLGIDPAALLAGAERCKQQLQMAASIQDLQYDSASGALSFKVRNQTGHKLISGFPEGRRMFVNIRAYLNGSLIYEVNPYDAVVGTLKGLNPAYSPNSPALGPNEAYVDELVYEMHPSSTVTGETETFHFALATGRYKDNRIPPKGFRIADASARLCVPVWHGVDSPGYFTSAEYAGGYDDVSMNIASGADSVEVKLYYQTTSREYVEFLRDEINGTGKLTLPQSAYIAQTDPFFSKLKAWGNTMWQLWEHNKNVPGAAPFMMTQASINVEPACTPPVPSLLYLEPGETQVQLHWSDVHSSDPNVIGYKVYYDQAGKAQLVAQVGLQTSYTDTNLLTGQLHCYKVTSIYQACESDYSNVLCAVPAQLVSIGQAKTMPAGSWVYINDAVVTAGTDLGWTAAFVEQPDRTAGLKLPGAESLDIGDTVRFTGLVSREDGEWQVSSLNVLGSSSGTTVKPLGLVNRSVANDPGLSLNHIGIDTSGLLVRTWGKVTGTEGASVFYINDGADPWDSMTSFKGIRVQLPAGITLPAVDSYAVVTGISRIEKHTLAEPKEINGQTYPAGTEIYIPSLWVRKAADLQTSEVTQ